MKKQKQKEKEKLSLKDLYAERDYTAWELFKAIISESKYSYYLEKLSAVITNGKTAKEFNDIVERWNEAKTNNEVQSFMQTEAFDTDIINVLN